MGPNYVQYKEIDWDTVDPHGFENTEIQVPRVHAGECFVSNCNRSH